MNEITKGFVQGYLAAFDSYAITDPGLQGEVAALKEKMEAFAFANSDPEAFYAKFAESGLQEEYSALVGKVALTGMGSAEAGSSEAPARRLSLKEFLKQYRAPFAEVKKAGYRHRAVAAYEQLFAVAAQTDSLLEGQIIIEQQRLLWEIVRGDSLDVLEPVLQALDPLQTAATVGIEKHIEAYQRAQTSEELDYALEKLELEKLALVEAALSKMTIAVHLADLLTGYCNSKLTTQLSGGQGNSGQASLMAMIALRHALRRFLRLVQEELGFTFEDLLQQEGLKIWLLSPVNVDTLGRVKEALNPQNYEVYRDIVENEILADISTIELLKRTPDKVYWPGFAGNFQDAYRRKAVAKAKKLNSDLTYYQYEEQLAKAVEGV